MLIFLNKIDINSCKRKQDDYLYKIMLQRLILDRFYFGCFSKMFYENILVNE